MDYLLPHHEVGVIEKLSSIQASRIDKKILTAWKKIIVIVLRISTASLGVTAFDWVLCIYLIIIYFYDYSWDRHF